MRLPGSLAKLDEAQHQELIAWLSMGLTDGQITDKIQKEKGWLTEVKRPTLLKNVNRWRKGYGQQAVIRHVADHLVTSNGRPKKNLDVIAEMEGLIRKQQQRVAKAAEKENLAAGLLLGMVSDEMKTLFAMLEKLGRLQLDTGLMRKVKVGEVAEDYQDEPEEEDDGPIISEEQRRILRLTQQAMQGDIVEGEYEEVEE